MIFVNGSMPRIVADELSRAGKDAKWKGELFPLNTKDPVWLEAVGVNGWLAITRDGKIRTRPAERQAIVEHHVGCFILTYRNDLKRGEIARLVLDTIEEMEEKFRTTPDHSSTQSQETGNLGGLFGLGLPLLSSFPNHTS